MWQSKLSMVGLSKFHLVTYLIYCWIATVNGETMDINGKLCLTNPATKDNYQDGLNLPYFNSYNKI